jgi:MFS family permease
MTATTTGGLDAARLVPARRAVFVVFAGNGFAFAAWASRIPDAKAQLGLTSGQLGLLLLAISAGAVIGLPSSGWVAGWYGGSGAVRIGLSGLLAGLVAAAIGIDLVDSVALVAFGLFVTGLGMGIWDVGMNLEGAAVERLLSRNLMSRFHAAFSGGTVVSALIGAGLSWAAVPIGVHLAAAAVVVAGISLWATTAFLPRRLEDEPAADDDAPRSGGVLWAWREPRTILIGLLVLIAAFTEGTANDWLSVAMVEGYDLPAWAGVLGFATFLVFMTLGRVIGTNLLDRYGRIPVLRTLLVLAGVGSLLVVFGTTPMAYVGAAVWGIGVSLGFPVGMSAAADDPVRAAARMSVVSTIGYTAFLAGPPLLGFLGDHVGILKALLAVGAGLVVALAVVPAVREPSAANAGAPPRTAGSDARSPAAPIASSRQPAACGVSGGPPADSSRTHSSPPD